MSPELAGLQAIRESARPNHTRGVESARLELPVDQTETDSPLTILLPYLLLILTAASLV